MSAQSEYHSYQAKLQRFLLIISIFQICVKEVRQFLIKLLDFVLEQI